MAAQPRRAATPGGLHRIAVVARKTGVSEHMLRVWERRYGALASHRSAAGYRLFSDDDVARICAIEELRAAGEAIGEIAGLTLQQLQRQKARGLPATRRPADPAAVARDCHTRFLSAIERLDLSEAGRALTTAAAALAPDPLVVQLVAPLLSEIGVLWQEDRLTLAQEHAASALLRDQLGELLRAATPGKRAKVLVATTPPGEQHELGALIAAVIAAHAGARVIYLGANTPASELAAAVERTKAVAAMLSVIALDEESTRARLEEARRAVPPGVELWVGGASVRRTPRAGIIWIRTLDELRVRARSASRSRSPRG